MKRIISLLLAIIAVVSLGFVLPVGADDNSADPSATVTAESTTEPVTTPVPLADAPALKSLTNGNEGLILKWGQVDYAQYYRVYRKGPGDTGWVCIAETPDCTYTDKDAKSGSTYKYTVRPVNEAGYGGYVKKGISTVRLDSPDGLKATNNKGNVKFQWNAVAGATGYRVYRRAPGIKGWTYIKTVKVCQYVDQNVKNNSKYRYTVKAICSGVHSGYYNEGALIKYLDAPVTQKIVTYPDRLVFEWGSVKGATTYRVYKRGAGESWRLLATVSGTSYTDKNVKKEAEKASDVQKIKALENNGKSSTIDLDVQYFADKTKHASERATGRSIGDSQIDDAISNPLFKGDVVIDEQGRKSVKYIGTDATVILNPDTEEVITTWKTGSRTKKKYGKGD